MMRNLGRVVKVAQATPRVLGVKVPAIQVGTAARVAVSPVAAAVQVAVSAPTATFTATQFNVAAARSLVLYTAKPLALRAPLSVALVSIESPRVKANESTAPESTSSATEQNPVSEQKSTSSATSGPEPTITTTEAATRLMVDTLNPLKKIDNILADKFGIDKPIGTEVAKIIHDFFIKRTHVLGRLLFIPSMNKDGTVPLKSFESQKSRNKRILKGLLVLALFFYLENCRKKEQSKLNAEIGDLKNQLEQAATTLNDLEEAYAIANGAHQVASNTAKREAEKIAHLNELLQVLNESFIAYNNDPELKTLILTSLPIISSYYNDYRACAHLEALAKDSDPGKQKLAHELLDRKAEGNRTLHQLEAKLNREKATLVNEKQSDADEDVKMKKSTLDRKAANVSKQKDMITSKEATLATKQQEKAQIDTIPGYLMENAKSTVSGVGAWMSFFGTAAQDSLNQFLGETPAIAKDKAVAVTPAATV